MLNQASKSGRASAILLIVVGIFLGANLITPAVAHVGGTISHLWGAPGHIKSKVQAFGDGRWLKKAAKAADSNLLDGINSTGFYEVGDKVADSSHADTADAAGRLASTSAELISSALRSTDGLQVLASVSITIPGTAPQLVEVTGNLMVWDNSNTQCPCEVDYHLGENGLVSPADNIAFVIVGNESQSGGPGAITAVFNAAPGTHTYELRVQSFDNTSDPVIVNYARMTAKTVAYSGTGAVPSTPSLAGRPNSLSGPAGRN